MNEDWMLTGAMVAGLVLGGLFFGGLWWTTRKGMVSTQPALWFIGSLLGRTMMILTGLYYVSDGNWQRLIVCLIGIMIARAAVLRTFSNTSPTQRGKI